MEKTQKFPEGEAPLKNTDNAFVTVEAGQARPQEEPLSGRGGGTVSPSEAAEPDPRSTDQ